MTFDRRDIRRSMDVYSLDNVYLGTVCGIAAGPASARSRPSESRLETRQSSAISGEALGPAPTQDIGNSGPDTQRASANYTAGSDGAELIGDGYLTVGKWWGRVARRTIPLDAVQTVSLERVILRLNASELVERERSHACGKPASDAPR